MPVHRDRRATPLCAKFGPPLRGRAERSADEQVKQPPAASAMSGGHGDLLIVGSLARGTATRCATLLTSAPLRTIPAIAVIEYGP